MKQFCSGWYLAIVLVGTSPEVFAQEPTDKTSVETLVKEALLHNPELEFYQAEIAAAKGERKQAGSWSNPELSADVGRKRASSGGLSSEGTAWSASIIQPFEYPGRLSLRKAIANRQVELAELGLKQFRAALASRVRQLAFDLFIAQERSEAADEVAQRGQELIDVLVQRDPAGITPLLETRIIEASIIKLRRKAVENARESQRSQFELNQLCGKPMAFQVRIEHPAWTQLSFPPVEELLTIASTNNFDLRMREIELAQQGFKIDLVRNERWPTISAGPFISRERAGEKDQTVGLSVSMPLPLWNRNTGNTEAAKARHQQAATALHLAQRNVERELREKVLSYEVQLREMSRWRTNIVEELRSAAELGDRHYRLGSLPLSTYVELQEQYLEALEAIYETQADAAEARQQIDLILGVNPPTLTVGLQNNSEVSPRNPLSK